MLTLSIFYLCGAAIVAAQSNGLNEIEMKNRLQLYNSEALTKWNALKLAEWNSSTDIGNTQKEVERVGCLFLETSLYIAVIQKALFGEMGLCISRRNHI